MWCTLCRCECGVSRALASRSMLMFQSPETRPKPPPRPTTLITFKRSELLHTSGFTGKRDRRAEEWQSRATGVQYGQEAKHTAIHLCFLLSIVSTRIYQLLIVPFTPLLAPAFWARAHALNARAAPPSAARQWSPASPSSPLCRERDQEFFLSAPFIIMCALLPSQSAARSTASGFFHLHVIFACMHEGSRFAPARLDHAHVVSPWTTCGRLALVHIEVSQVLRTSSSRKPSRQCGQ